LSACSARAHAARTTAVSEEHSAHTRIGLLSGAYFVASYSDGVRLRAELLDGATWLEVVLLTGTELTIRAEEVTYIAVLDQDAVNATVRECSEDDATGEPWR